MGEQISSSVDEGLNETIEGVAEYHDISKSRAIELLLQEGVRAREMRYRFEQLDAKLDLLIESLGGEPVAPEAVNERFEAVSERGLPGGLSGVDLADNPFPYFQSTGNFPDRSDEEAEIRQAVINERDAVERTDET
ncbi:hypothetical protein LPA44_13510 [Halobacterium sp. KA-4]|uniref:hypothetical protein n=1 Tax=Halobacterium sp. KA-4 TaxID=2896367 RepID=UPI001E58F790|nr:hypothetical protein [Halobacterium sp. KA-4]MCD2200904.1 hypothetical protein [Halobacterium sp. KA-4]